MIRVIDNYGIDANDNCYTVGTIRKVTDKKTSETQEVLTGAHYYSAFADALQWICKHARRMAIP